MRYPAWLLFGLMVGCCIAGEADAVLDETAKSEFPAKPKINVDATPEQAAAIARLIAQLGDDEFNTRNKAHAELKKLGAIANKQLRAAAAETKDAEVKSAAVKLVRESETETWEGYYYYSLEPFETAIADGGAGQVRFWFTVSRSDSGSFTAECDEEDQSLGKSQISGTVDCKSGALEFQKQYTDQASHGWTYEGKWNAKTGRIEGTYGPGSGGFVLYPRALTDAEKQKFRKKE